ncbi:MAG: aminotransferase class III-fold pyridoxal phosphate-dependent enzyme [Arhodomonas sp.]|nr:aminotransferase class III-fold pyridoxal phosphate-dependent enzyme [Arhodomonas sp.]
MSEMPGQLSPMLKQSSDVIAVSGEGMYVYDESGAKYLDFTSGIGVLSTGHCHPKVVEAAQRQVGQMIHAQYAIVKHRPILELSKRLGGYMPGNIDSLFYASAGTEAVEASIRLARQATGKPNIIAFRGCFHGRTMGSLSTTTSSAPIRQGLQPMMGGVVVAPFPDTYWYGWDEETAAQFCLKELDYILQTYSVPKETAAMLIEPVQGEAGYIPANTTFMKGLQQRCREHGILFILDEVQSGNGRTGSYWGHRALRYRAGYRGHRQGHRQRFPAVRHGGLGCAHVPRAGSGSQGGTYGGNAVACAAASATLDVIREEGLVENARERGAQLRARLEELKTRYPEIGNVSGMGLMLGTYMVDRRRAARWRPLGAAAQGVREARAAADQVRRLGRPGGALGAAADRR